MPEKKERKPEEEEPEMKIPVFTVIKNGAILKNIFLINKSPSPQSITSVNPDQENGEEILIVGRHPDCDIMLTHPSISRFHAQIQTKTSSNKLAVIDLSSVHGTWVSEIRVEPGVPVELNEGDTIKIGGSTRVYRLHWVPLSTAYDMDNPFVLPLDMSKTELKEVENQSLEEENETETHQGENSVSIENGKTEVQHSLAVEVKKANSCQDEISARMEDKGTQSLDLIFEGIVSLFSDEYSELILKKEISSFGLDSVDFSLAVGVNILVSDRQQLDKDTKIAWHDSVNDVISKRENFNGLLKIAEKNSEVIVNSASPCDDTKEGKILQEIESQNTLQNDIELRVDAEVCSGPLMKESKNLSFVLGEVPSEIKTEKLKEEKQTLQSFAAWWWPLSQTGNKKSSCVEQNLNLMMNQSYEYFDEENCWPAAENQNALRQGHRLKETKSFNSMLLKVGSWNSSLPCGEVLSEIADSKIYQTPQSLFAPEGFSENFPLRSGKRSSMHSIWTRRGKPASVLQIQTSRRRGKTKEDCNNVDVEFPQKNKLENEPILKIPFSGLEGMEEETFTPYKENFTPDGLLMKSSQRKGKLQELMHSRSGLSKFTCSPNITVDEELTLTSDKENQTPKVLREQNLARDIFTSQMRLEQERVPMKNRAERVPFQPLLVNSTGKRRPNTSISNATTTISSSVNFTQTTKVLNSSSAGEGRRCWTMVVDTTTLVDKESRKSLQLLQGLKGTQLVIPRMVVRELDCMKRRSLLRTSEFSSPLEWIEECMVKTKGWIHIQSSVEEGRSTAPTPPASPQSHLTEGSGDFSYGTTSWTTFLSRTSLTEIVSPTAEDLILDCALLFRKMKTDGQLVLLSNNVTMKIKAMAEGLVCETAQEFRESLVNPFSERFLWADSSPRGRTWSYLDDIVLRDKYNFIGHLKKPSKGGDSAKGLKLILLHNSHYNAHINSVR